MAARRIGDRLRHMLQAANAIERLAAGKRKNVPVAESVDTADSKFTRPRFPRPDGPAGVTKLGVMLEIERLAR